MRLINLFIFCSVMVNLSAEAKTGDQINKIKQKLHSQTRYEEQKKRFNELQSQKKEPLTPYSEVISIPMLQSDKTGAGCIETKVIDVSSITILDSSDVEKVIKPFLNRCNSMVSINNLINSISNLYIANSYVTSRAFMKPQNMADGVLVISSMESKIDDLISEGINTDLVFPFIQGQYLNLRDLEVGIEQLNRLRSMQATMAIKPGKEETYSNIIITGQRISPSWYGSVSVNNFGTSKSGKYQISGSLSYENIFDINDVISINANTTDQQSSKNNSIGSGISYAFPISRSYLKVGYSEFSYDQTIAGLNDIYDSKGDTKTFDLSLDYKLFHRKSTNGKLGLSLQRKKNENYLQDLLLKTSSSSLSIIQLGYTHNYSSDDSNGHFIFKYHHGLPWFNADSAEHTSPEFNKYTLDLSYSKRFKLSPQRTLLYDLSLHGQYANKDIIGSEQIGVGGPYSVRGFKGEYALSGNKGGYIRNELSLFQQIKQAVMSPYLALDYGRVSENERSYGGYMLGAAIGIRLHYADAALDLYKSLPVLDSNEQDMNNNGFFGATLNYNF
ncbi:ShlB/FhaC/HecB family hemolysin secretion/activation protein [Moritella yayanosii]|uniref:ShlB/FhaC/HecB family hemolysin secretion/activation protein n=1 Tax=Moritella yayanosii TaxID=69539 RepID=UPI001E3D6E25|nr:ShlB/FhaC/HecB family hemolysin secretion/activation protein [Moritella yayanosii]